LANLDRLQNCGSWGTVGLDQDGNSGNSLSPSWIDCALGGKAHEKFR